MVQRVRSASVSLTEECTTREVAAIERGLLVLLGIRTDDTGEDARWLAEKLVNLRIFEDQSGKMNLSLRDVEGSILLVSNFTLYADCRRGRRPSFAEAASGPDARGIYDQLGSLLQSTGIQVQCGIFGGEMRVVLENEGPVTLVIDTPSRAEGA